jgi:hypothetical protein
LTTGMVRDNNPIDTPATPLATWIKQQQPSRSKDTHISTHFWAASTL